MRFVRVGLLIVFCLTFGFAAGWYAHHKSPFLRIGTSVSSPTPAVKTGTSQVEFAFAARAGPAGPSTQERVALLRSLTSSGIEFNFPLFEQGKLSTQAATFYKLSPAQQERLNASVLRAKQRLKELETQFTRIDPSSTARKIVLTVPEFPIEGGLVYTELLGDISAILGEERYVLFDAVSGNNLERSLDNFGLETNRYEISGQPIEGGFVEFKMQRDYSGPATRANPYPYAFRTSGSSIGAKRLLDKFPILRSHINPQDFREVPTWEEVERQQKLN